MSPAPGSVRSVDLTPAEQRIYRLIVEQGLRDREIAKETGLSLRTVKWTIHQLLQKKGAASRLDLAVKHWQKGTEC